MDRDALNQRLKNYDCSEIQHARDILHESSDEEVKQEDLLRIAERVSVAIDHHYSGDELHPLWELERDLSQIIEANR